MRSFARTSTAIWQDPEWVALSGNAQRAYMLLTSQSKLSLVGCVDYKPTRWAKFCSDWTLDVFEAALGELEEAGYISLDLVTDELLVTKFTQDDGITPTNKNLRKGVWTALKAVDSATLRAIAVANMPEALFAHGDVPTGVLTLRNLTPEPVYEPAFQPASEPASEPAPELPPSPPPPEPEPLPAAVSTADQRRSRLEEACELIARRDAERRGNVEDMHKWLPAAVRGKVSDYAPTAYAILAATPTLTADELADRLDPRPPEPVNTSSFLPDVAAVVPPSATDAQLVDNVTSIGQLRRENPRFQRGGTA